MFFPLDPCHSKYASISKIAHSLLVDTILSTYGQKQYLLAFWQFQFPPGWGRIQSPITHLDSYQLQKHARASIIIPLLLRCLLKEQWVNKSFLQAISQTFSPQNPVNSIVEVFAAIAKSKSVLAWKAMSVKDRGHLKDVIVKARKGLQQLLKAAAIAAEELQPARSQSRSQLQLHASRSLSPAMSQILVFTSRPIETKKSKEFRAIKKHPNMHIALHYVEQLKEYAVPNNCNVFAGEDKHW
ncbi:hypothetical protein CIMG_07785 [Paecilomyces variotii No. 5]|uniref:Uncharacterized protein n=1 Tax=Byssochlamys spectabilis (strain No. 5 / NBRC 109023) TaxID=1356009 RepID=V5I686_BYSSN|nr:hypothetical protein CIMG_07785 [Paecilomyces variotii No. 5]